MHKSSTYLRIVSLRRRKNKFMECRIRDMDDRINERKSWLNDANVLCKVCDDNSNAKYLQDVRHTYIVMNRVYVLSSFHTFFVNKIETNLDAFWILITFEHMQKDVCCEHIIRLLHSVVGHSDIWSSYKMNCVGVSTTFLVFSLHKDHVDFVYLNIWDLINRFHRDKPLMRNRFTQKIYIAFTHPRCSDDGQICSAPHGGCLRWCVEGANIKEQYINSSKWCCKLSMIPNFG